MKRAMQVRKFWVAVLIVCVVVLLFALTRLRFTEGHVSGEADRVVVEKSRHTLTLLRQGNVLKTYRVALGRGGSGQKTRAGDNRVPEGSYRIIGRNAHSAFHRALRIGYPTPEQILQAHTQGIDPGGDIMVHGIRNGLGWIGSLQRYIDWTKGCIAVTDPEIEEIWEAVPDGTVLEIRR